MIEPGTGHGDDAHGDLEQKPHGQQRCGGELVVLIGLHEDVELAAVEVLEEVQGGRQDDEVPEGDPGGEEHGDRECDRQHVTALLGREGGHQEAVGLQEEHRQREDEGEDQGDGQGAGERLADPERDRAIALWRRRQGPDVLVEPALNARQRGACRGRPRLGREDAGDLPDLGRDVTRVTCTR